MKKTYPKTHLCPRCGINPALFDIIFGILPCQSCQDADSKIKITKSPEFYSINKKDRVQRIRDKNQRDLLQPYESGKINKDFFKAYPDKIEDYQARKELEKL
jgi:ribosomal protein L37AE/L43A